MVTSRPHGRNGHEVEQAVHARAKDTEPDIRAESGLGKQVLSLRGEKDNLLDTVWLATSCGQIGELWQQGSFLSGDEADGTGDEGSPDDAHRA